MRRWLSILLLAGILACTFQSLLAWSAFVWNQSYIEKALCENRGRPEKHCHGKCHLKKELAKSQERQGKAQSNLEQAAPLLFFQEAGLPHPLVRESVRLPFPSYPEEAVCGHSASFFHPPLV